MADTSLPEDRFNRIEQICQQAVELCLGDPLFASTGGRRILYTQFDQSGPDLVLSENSR